MGKRFKALELQQVETGPGALHRTPATWLAYSLLGYFAYLQAAPGAVVPFLRDELGFSYPLAGFHLTLFALGGLLASVTSVRVEQHLGRSTLAWVGAGGMAGGAIGLVAGAAAAVTLPAALVMGWTGTWVAVAVQAALADEHGAKRSVAFSESNVLGSLGALALPAVVGVSQTVGLGWRFGVLLALGMAVIIAGGLRGVRLVSAPVPRGPTLATPRPAPGAWPVLALMFSVTAAEWSIGFWSASFLDQEVGLPSASAVALSSLFFAGMLAGRVAGSVLARRRSATQLLGASLVLTAMSFPLFWLATEPAVAAIGLVLLGLGLGNSFPLALALTIGTAPEQAARLSARALAVATLAVLTMPLTVGTLASALGLRWALGLVLLLLGLAASMLLLARGSADNG